MNTPGFTAEGSLHKMGAGYQGTEGDSGDTVAPVFHPLDWKELFLSVARVIPIPGSA